MQKPISRSHKRSFLFLATLSCLLSAPVRGANDLETTIADLPAAPHDSKCVGDWLVAPVGVKTGVYRGSQPREIIMANGLVRRTWRLSPNAATVALDNLITGESLLRSVRPEALVELDGVKYAVGGLEGQGVHNYLDPRWLDRMTANPAAFRFTSFQVGKTAERFPWKKRAAWMPRDLPWPPPGVSLTLSFAPPPTATPAVSRIRVNVHYEMYDGLPLLSKWITVENAGGKPVRLHTFVSEILAVVEPESIVDPTPRVGRLPNLGVETDYTFGGMSGPNHGAGGALGCRSAVRHAGELRPEDALPAGMPSAPWARPDHPAGRQLRLVPHLRAAASTRPTASGAAWPCGGCTGPLRRGSPRTRS